MSKLFFLFIHLFIAQIFFSQQFNFQWAKQFGGISSICRPNAMAADANGNVYIVGLFKGSVDFDPGPSTFYLTSGYNFNTFISKYDYRGNFLWAQKAGDTLSYSNSDIAVDDLGNVYLAGIFRGTVDFDPGPRIFNITSRGKSDIFLSKYNSNGLFVWAKQFGGDSSDVVKSLSIDQNENIYIAGSFKGTSDFDPGISTFSLTSMNNESVFISKVNSSGKLIWAKQFYSPYNQTVSAITNDSFGNVYLAGSFDRIMDFDPGPSNYTLMSIGDLGAYAVKLDSAGNFAWAKVISTSLHSPIFCNDIKTDLQGNVITTGFFQGTIDFNPDNGAYIITANGTGDAYVSKLDVSGNFVWAKNMGGYYSTVARSLAIDPIGNIYFNGDFIAAVDFDPSPGVLYLNTAGPLSVDFFISKLNPNGDLAWAKQVGGSSQNHAYNIVRDRFGNIYSCGAFIATSDFNVDAGILYISAIGNSDGFLHKIGEGLVGIENHNNSIEGLVYPNPSTGLIQITIPNAFDNSSINIFNSLGQTVYQSSGSSENPLLVDISSQKAGLFIVEIVSKNISYRTKLIKN